MDENTPEVTEVTATPEATFAEETLIPNTDKVAEAIQKARAQEKAKLYPQVEKLQEELALLRSKEQEREAKEAERKAARQAREAEAAAERKKQEEAELEVRDLLAKKEQEWQAEIKREREDREKAFALLEREREFQELSAYRQQRLEQERDAIIPELIDLISGNTKDEIESSIAGLKERSSKIFDSVAQVAQQSRKEMVGTRITSPASGPLDNDSDSRQYSPNDINNMSMADYAKNRAKLLGTAGNNRGQGLFGN
jgi:HD-GYP domain-containing protein (c-di-GMP phosphodiesterase class II)